METERERDERCLKHPGSAASAKLISGRTVKLDCWQLAQVWEKEQLPQDWQIAGDFSFPKICQTKNTLKTNPTMQSLTLQQPLEYLPSAAAECQGLEAAEKPFPNTGTGLGPCFTSSSKLRSCPSPSGSWLSSLCCTRRLLRRGSCSSSSGRLLSLLWLRWKHGTQRERKKHSGDFRNVTAHGIFVCHSLLVRTLPPLKNNWLSLFICSRRLLILLWIYNIPVFLFMYFTHTVVAWPLLVHKFTKVPQ